MTNNETELSQDQLEALQEVCERLLPVIRQMYDALVEWVQDVVAQIRQSFDQLTRSFLMAQLLEWRLPYPIADYVSRMMYYPWAWKLGMWWWYRKLVYIT